MPRDNRPKEPYKPLKAKPAPTPEPSPPGIRGVDFNLVTRRTSSRVSAFAQAESADDYDDDDEPTPISDENSTNRMLLKIGVMVERQSVHVRQIPHIDTKLTEVATKQVVMEERQSKMDEHLLKIEKNGHPCKNQQVIDRHTEESSEWRTDKEEGIKTRQMVKTTTEDAQRAVRAADTIGKSVGSILFKTFGGVAITAVTIILVVIGAAWNTGGRIEGLSQRVTAESKLRKQQDDTITARLDRLPTKDQVVTRESLTSFENAVKHDEFEDRCAKLSSTQKINLGRQIQQGRLPASFLCP